MQVGFVATVKLVHALAERIKNQYPDDMKLALTEYRDRDFALLDVLSPQATKDVALRFLAERYHIPMERTMAIGDNWNDFEMLGAAGFGVLMSNAPKELIDRGFTTTGSNDEAGVAQAINKYVLP